jgi:predicted peptidase
MIIDDLNERFTIDNKRIYVAGFSNGGQMSARCAVEMGDVFAAACANAGFLPADTIVTITRNLPVLFQVGNKDDRFLPDSVTEISMDAFNEILDTTTIIQKFIQTHLNSFGIENNYTVQGSETTQLIASYPVAPSSPEHVFHFSLVRDMFHVYPNGSNHWMRGAEVQWEWMSQFVLP